MLRWSLLTAIIVALLVVCGFVFAADGTWWNLVKNIGYAVVAVALVWGLVAVANHFKLTGQSFHLPDWLDIIAGVKPAPSPDCNRIGMAIVIAGFLLGLFYFAGSFVQP